MKRDVAKPFQSAHMSLHRFRLARSSNALELDGPPFLGAVAMLATGAHEPPDAHQELPVRLFADEPLRVPLRTLGGRESAVIVAVEFLSARLSLLIAERKVTLPWPDVAASGPG